MRLVACGACHAQYDVSGIEEATFPCACGEQVENRPPEAIETDIRRCASCGALVDLEAAQCEYCDAVIERDRRKLGMICPECYARNAPTSRFCTGCGVRFNPQPAGFAGRTLPCPACAAQMTFRSVGGMALVECPDCAGTWVPGEHFDRLVRNAVDAARTRASEGLGVRRPETRRAKPVFQREVVYRQCPECGARMTRRNFGRRSGVIVDWCSAHGTWLDAEELEAVVEFIVQGGLESPRARTGAGPETPPDPSRIEALATAERLMAEEKMRTRGSGFSWTSGSRSEGFSLGDLLKSLLD